MRATSRSAGHAPERYEVALASGRVEKQLDAVPDAHLGAILARVHELSETPRPRGCRKLGGDTYRIRVGTFRVIYTVHDEDRRVLIDKVARRSESTYR